MQQTSHPGLTELSLGGACLIADTSGALFWPEQNVLVVADLHLEKGSSLARRGILLPPYDTDAILAKLAAVIAKFSPASVIALGDSFHDPEGGERLTGENRAVLLGLQRGRNWVWIFGNHDPAELPHVGGEFLEVLRIGPLTFRHEPSVDELEVLGHYHPVARVAVRGQSIRRRCFAASSRRIVMPAFGAFAGGLNVRHADLAGVIGTRFWAHLLGPERIYSIKAENCATD